MGGFGRFLVGHLFPFLQDVLFGHGDVRGERLRRNQQVAGVPLLSDAIGVPVGVEVRLEFSRRRGDAFAELLPGEHDEVHLGLQGRPGELLPHLPLAHVEGAGDDRVHLVQQPQALQFAFEIGDRIVVGSQQRLVVFDPDELPLVLEIGVGFHRTADFFRGDADAEAIGQDIDQFGRHQVLEHLLGKSHRLQRLPVHPVRPPRIDAVDRPAVQVDKTSGRDRAPIDLRDRRGRGDAPQIHPRDEEDHHGQGHGDDDQPKNQFQLPFAAHEIQHGKQPLQFVTESGKYSTDRKQNRTGKAGAGSLGVSVPFGVLFFRPEYIIRRLFP